MNGPGQSVREWVAQPVVIAPGARRAVGVATFVVATAFGAYVAVPLVPVPFTLQTLFVLLAGVVLGPWAGAGAMAIYVAAGAAGAPVFSGGQAGLPWLLGPTGGYLLALPAAAFAAGLLAGRNGRGLRLLAALATGAALVYAGGVSWLWILTRQDPGVLLAQGVLPFLPGDLVKIVVAWAVVRGLGSAGFGRLR